ncbi:MAG: hypothetical protein ACM3N1_00305 [Accumulibacter sp.]
MKGGYFSRLVKQTGIAFGETRNSLPDALERQSTKSEEHDAALSIDVEERQIAPRQDQEIKNIDITDHVREDPESSTQILESENTLHPSEEIKHPVKERFEKPSHLSQKQEPAERKYIVSGMDVKLSPETVRSQNEINRKELLESSEAIKINNVDKEQVRQSVKPSTSSDQVYRRETSSGSKSTDQIFQAKTSQVYLKDVRDWVAGTSNFNNEKIKSGDSIETDDTGKVAPRNENRAPGASYPAVSYPKPVEQRGIEGPEINDFHLSIGTISLTIEEPQKGTQGMEPPRVIKAERREQKETSRLSRHYIRI